MFLQAQGAILSGEGYSEEGYRVRMEGARLGGEDTCPPARVPLWTTDVSDVSDVSVLKKAYPCKGRGYA